MNRTLPDRSGLPPEIARRRTFAIIDRYRIQGVKPVQILPLAVFAATGDQFVRNLLQRHRISQCSINVLTFPQSLIPNKPPLGRDPYLGNLAEWRGDLG